MPLFAQRLKSSGAPCALALLCTLSSPSLSAQSTTAPQSDLFTLQTAPALPDSAPLTPLIAALDSTSALPDAPDPGPQTPSDPSQTPSDPPQAVPDHTHPQQTKRILGIMPNFRSVSADQRLPPQSVKDKFVIAGKDSFDYSSFIIAGIQAGISQAERSYPEFGNGVGGYGQYFWHTLVDTADENFMVGGVFPALFHQDSRFYTLDHGSGGHRALYAATRVLITRRDNGDTAPNFSEIIGAGAAAGLSSTYYPTQYRTWTKVGQKWLTAVIIDSANFTFKEFWPNINDKLFHTH